jgi:mono/diheme cytochrome c family protein
MIPGRMSRSVRVFCITGAAAAVAAIATACGTEKIQVPPSNPLHQGAVLFSQRCSGCHTLSYAGTNGSAPNVRTAQAISGPNFNVRCERPVTRVLYAIQNGGFSGAYMPQNVVVGPDAIEVAKFVSTYAGRQAPQEPGTTPCQNIPVGQIPPGTPGLAASNLPTATTAASAKAPTTTAAAAASATAEAAAPPRAASKAKQKKSSRS